MGDRIWTDEQVAALNERQKRSDLHPYTCPGDYPECENRRNLIATPCGWVCACGRYRQGWSHEAGGRVPRAYTEAEVAAREAAAAEAMRKALLDEATNIADALQDAGQSGHAAGAERVRLLILRERLPAADALARALEQARAAEREACALIADRRAGIRGDHGIAAAIRARGKEVGGE